MTADPVTPSLDLDDLRAKVQQLLPQYLADLEALVDLECGTFLPEGVNRVADLMRDRFDAAGWSVERREHVAGPGEAQLGDVLVGKAEGRTSDAEITIFDSTGLAIQDLGIALAAMERADALDLPTIEL